MPRGARGVGAAAGGDTGRGGVRLIGVRGSGDRSGGASYDEGLSERRAGAGREELGRRGVRVSVSTESRGEADPLVATDDGVRQPQNRRASIVLQ